MLKSLEQYRNATEEFGQAISGLKILIKNKNLTKFKNIHRFSVAAYDILYSFDIAAEYSIDLLKLNNQWLEQKQIDKTTPISPKYFEIHRLELMYKALFYFLRVFQDEANRLLLGLLGSEPGPGSSMQKSLKNEQNPVTQALNKTFPEYKDWFFELRERRNRIKSYGDFDTVFMEDDIKIRFILIDEQDEEKNNRNLEFMISPIFFDDYFGKAITICKQLIEKIYFVIHENIGINDKPADCLNLEAGSGMKE